MNEKKSKQSLISMLINLVHHKKDERTLLHERLQSANKNGIIDLDALAMMEGVLQVSELRVRDIMVPRTHMVVIEEDLSVNDMLPIISASGHSRFPVIGESLDETVGILLAKDLIRYSDNDSKESFELTDILRPAVFVPESKRLNVLLKDFRSSRNHMAIVIDEYSGVAGLVTIEDVLEQIVGEIDDEHDAADSINIQRQGLQKYRIRGLTPIEEFNSFFDSEFSDEKFDTVAGLVISKLGHLPARGENINIGSYMFTVLSANSRRINNLQVILLPDPVLTTDT